MLSLKKITKKYVTGDLTQTALDNVSINFRDNEFVAILGHSGSGKTTLLNIVGGLDRYDSGDLVINGVSTKQYKERDWDTYRNHSIGFVFQNYNLIPHQSILSNVELAMTISGVSKSERRKRAKQALKSVGLGDQCHKKPNQLSGGQMQRVAIARALVNNPDILLADEPTGALDSETSIQVMELLKEVAKDKLVIMVTHNPELAKMYANRIVKLKDGKITDDSNPLENTNTVKLSIPDRRRKASMSWLTALSLSFHNLATKKGRTILTSIAGSIGIIGIALILSLSNGVNKYMSDIQKNTMASYPISIDKECVAVNESFTERHKDMLVEKEADHDMDAVYAAGEDLEKQAEEAKTIKYNNLEAFKEYLEKPDCEINKYVGLNGIVYNYNTAFDVFAYDPDGEFLNINGSPFEGLIKTGSSEESHGHMFGKMSEGMSTGATASRNKNFGELTPGKDNETVSDIITDNYSLIYGEWPKAYNEITLVLDQNNEISSTTLYELGILPAAEYRSLIEKINNQEKIELEETTFSYEDICKKSFYVIPACDTFVKKSNGTFEDISDNMKEIEKLKDNAVELKITGIIKYKNREDGIMLSFPVGYTSELTKYLIDYTKNSDVVKAQMADTEHNVLSNTLFNASTDEDKITDAANFINNLGVSEKADLAKQLISMRNEETGNEEKQIDMSEEELAGFLDDYMKNPESDLMLEAYEELVPAASYEGNLEKFGYVDLKSPSSINIYADNFEDKEAITKCIDDYNATVAQEDEIEFVDYVGTLMSSVTDIVDVISYVLIAFVAVSLIVSTIMIGIITYISVLERTKEIGILRAMGASKRNITQVFSAETFIIGLMSGVIGIGVTLLILIPGNMIIHKLVGTTTVNATLPVTGSLILVLVSIVLTMIGGFIPAKRAAKKDPVSALRTE